MVAGRQHPILSPVSLLSALLLLAGVGGSLWLAGGAAFSPGPLTAQASASRPLGGFASHAAFEHDCEQCHAPWRGVEASRCENCHTEIAAERAAGGMHGRIEAVDQCAACHPDHEGRAFDAAAAGAALFDHRAAGFSLQRHFQDYAGAALACESCHTPAFDLQDGACFECHTAHSDRFMRDHALAFGMDCLACHNGVDRTTGFDHASTALPLDGAHQALACSACHTAAAPPEQTPADCAGCHAEPAVHAGVLGDDCAGCHTTAAWLPARLEGASFDHASTGFALATHRLDFDGAPMNCAGCHPGAGPAAASFARANDTACLRCHALAEADFMAQHVAGYGPACRGCHDGTGGLADFDHSRVFPLDGAHAPLPCAACHAQPALTLAGAACAGCHAEPEVHAGLFGADCAACHTSAAWTPAALRAHTFPLDHGGQLNECAVCHTENYVAYTCYGCHEHDQREVEREHQEEGIRANELNDCAACHPTGQED
jgi:hypothetical protein